MRRMETAALRSSEMMYGITISGYRDLPSRLPSTASDLYANNQRKFLLSLVAEGDNKAFVLDKVKFKIQDLASRYNLF